MYHLLLDFFIRNSGYTFFLTDKVLLPFLASLWAVLFAFPTPQHPKICAGQGSLSPDLKNSLGIFIHGHLLQPNKAQMWTLASNSHSKMCVKMYDYLQPRH